MLYPLLRPFNRPWGGFYLPVHVRKTGRPGEWRENFVQNPNRKQNTHKFLNLRAFMGYTCYNRNIVYIALHFLIEVTYMEPTGAILFLPREGGKEPILLKKLLFQPGAVWLAEALKAHGVKRFFVVCKNEDREAAATCFPQDTELVTEGSPDASEKLASFLNAQEGEVAVLTKPVLLSYPTSGPTVVTMSDRPETGLYNISAAVLVGELDEGKEFADALSERGSREGLGKQAVSLLDDSGEDWMMNEMYARQITAKRLADMGVRLIDPNAVYADPTVTVGEGTVILPGTILRGRTVIGKNCEIGPNAMITDCTVGDRVVVNASQLNESVIEDSVKIGPFAYIRPNCHVGRGVKVGDFVELKNSTIGPETKISHLTYVGDSDVGGHVNFGCGTVTVNYDGSAKFRTTIGDGAFLGCNTNLVAPVKVGVGAYTAAGSTITDDVPDDSLAIARSLQVNKKQWALKRRKRNS